MHKNGAKLLEIIDVKNMIYSCILALLWLALSFVIPHQSYISSDNPTLGYPNVNHETVSTGWLIGIVYPFSWIFICLICFLSKKLENRVKSPILFAAIWCNAITVSFTSIVVYSMKNYVGRYSPNFYEKCGDKYSTPDNCSLPDKDDVYDLMRSFPSNHAATSFASTWFLIRFSLCSLAVREPLACIMIYVMIFAPLSIGCSRIRDYERHPSDVTAGFFIGYIISELFWKTYKHKIFEDFTHEASSGRALIQQKY